MTGSGITQRYRTFLSIVHEILKIPNIAWFCFTFHFVQIHRDAAPSKKSSILLEFEQLSMATAFEHSRWLSNNPDVSSVFETFSIRSYINSSLDIFSGFFVNI